MLTDAPECDRYSSDLIPLVEIEALCGNSDCACASKVMNSSLQPMLAVVAGGEQKPSGEV